MRGHGVVVTFGTREGVDQPGDRHRRERVGRPPSRSILILIVGGAVVVGCLGTGAMASAISAAAASSSWGGAPVGRGTAQFARGRVETPREVPDSGPVSGARGTPSSASGDLGGVTCLSTIDCQAMGERNDGPLIGQVYQPPGPWTLAGGAEGGSLSGDTCAGPDDCWAVGTTASGLGTLIEQNTGDGWGTVTSPSEGGGGYTELSAVTCVSPSDCWAVGGYDNANGVPETLIEWYHGTSWSIVYSPNEGSGDWLLGIACAGSAECWAVGQYGDIEIGEGQPLLLEYNGAGWSGPAWEQYGNTLNAITCVNASDCWAAGNYFDGSEYQTLVFQYNGTDWSRGTSPDAGSPDPSVVYNSLNAVACSGADDCWAVGLYDEPGGLFNQTLIEQFDGTGWTVVGSPDPGGADILYGVACASSTDCWAVGEYWPDPAITADYQTLIEELTVTSWTAAASPDVSSADVLGNVACDGSVNCWAVGSSFSGSQTVIEQSVQGDAPPMVTSLTPAAGPVGGGQTVTVNGYGFVAGMTVTLGGVAVTPSNVTPDSFTFTTPSASAGYVTLQATDGYGSSLEDGNVGYIYAALAAYHPLTPFRILDTRSSSCIQCGTGALLPSGTTTLQVTGYSSGGESVPADATAVALNVTAVSGSAASFIGVYPAGTGRPDSSNLNFLAQTNTANLVVVALGPTGAVDLYNSLGAVDVVADVEGYFTAPSGTQGQFHPIAPLRVCDTRLGQPANPCNEEGTADLALGPGQVAKVDVAAVTSAQGDIPSDGSAEAAVLNLTAVSGTQATYLSVFPSSSNGTCSTAVPQSSTLNVSARTNQANRVIVPLGPATNGGHDTDVCVYNSLGSIDFLLDANGWFGASGAAAGTDFQVIGPSRICDTRAGMGTACSGDSLTPGGVLPVQVTGMGGVPSSGPVAVVANLTAVSGTSMTYFTLYPAGGTTPNASDLNVDAQQNLPNLAITELGSGGTLDLYNSLGTIDAVLDVEGWFQ